MKKHLPCLVAAVLVWTSAPGAWAQAAKSYALESAAGLRHGWPRLDEAVRTRDLLPLYTGAGKDAVKDENIDLGDGRKKVGQAFTALTDEAVADLLANMKALVGK